MHKAGWYPDFSALSTSTGWASGDVAWNQGATILGTAGSRYTIVGWRRLTTGTGHVLGTDWAEMRVLTGT
jgi:hypothetical protein